MKLSQKQQQQLGRALALHETGELEQAVKLYRSLLRALPVATVAISNLGVALLQLGQCEEGLCQLERSLRIDPKQPEVLVACAMAYVEQGEVGAALESCQRALLLAPSLVSAYHTQGLALHMLGRYEEALLSYASVLKVSPYHFEAYNNRGLSLLALERFEEALGSFDRANQLQPNHIECLQNLAQAYSRLGKRGEALEACLKLLALEPRHIETRLLQADLLAELSLLAKAKEVYQFLIDIFPDDPRAWHGIASILGLERRYDEALPYYRQALKLNASLPFLRNDALGCSLETCQWDLFQSLWSEPTSVDQFRPFDSLRLPFSLREQLATAKGWAKRELGDPAGHAFTATRIECHRPLRIGFVSSDFHNHPVAFLMERFIPALDRRSMHVIGIPTTHTTTVQPAVKASFHDWLDVSGIDGYQAAEKIRSAKLDVAINLNGITIGERTELFAMRLAPLQVSFLGYAGTTAVPTMDYLIADSYAVPECLRLFYTEHIAYMPDTFFVPNTADVSAEPITRADEGLPENRVVFCCFNNSYKITPDIFDIWMRLLDQVPGSVLWLSKANHLVEVNLKKEAASRGVDPQRLVFAKFRESRADHLRRLQLADLFLDTFYYNAHTTASDALWAGVPVLTCPGETFASRVAGSLLKAAGMDDLIADSREAYEAKALQLASDPALLAEVRARLAHNKKTYPVFDMPRYARNFERLLLAMWQRYEQGLPPAHLSLEPTVFVDQHD